MERKQIMGAKPNFQLQIIHHDEGDIEDIQLYVHCRECLKEKPLDISPREWARLEVGWTRTGFQIWCTRHNIIVDNVELKIVPEREKTDEC